MSTSRLIIAGTSGAGKTEIVRTLCGGSRKYTQVKAVTTRPARESDRAEYEYVSDDAFTLLVEQSALLIHTSYRQFRYGMRQAEVQLIEDDARIPVFAITPESAVDLMRPEPHRYISFFVDASDRDLEHRLETRDGAVHPVARVQRRDDRTYQGHFVYRLLNEDIRASVAFIMAAVESESKTGVLSGRLIWLGIRCGVYLESASDDHVSGASYDLSLGDEYFYGGQIKALSEANPILFIEPYDYAIVTSNELASFPNDVCGRFDLAVKLFTQGVILSNGPQVDPGFRGPLFCLLFNTSSSPVLLKRRQHYATLEISKLIEPTQPYLGQYQSKRLLDYLPANAARGAINELKKEVEGLRNESKNLQALILALVSVVLAVVAILVVVK